MYDSYGDMLTQNISTSGTTKYTYNTLGWVMSKTAPSGNRTVNNYDNDGKIIKSVDNTGTTRFVYDGDERLIQQVDPSEYVSLKDGLNNADPTNTYSDSNVGYRYTYNSSGNMATKTLPNNEVMTYNSDGKITSVHNPTSGATESNITYTYDDSGNILTTSENGTQKVNYIYDDSNQLTRENNLWLNETIAYAYDSDGNILTKTVYPYTTASDISSDTPTHTYTYRYDNSNDPDQLTSYDSKAIIADADGNMLAFNGWTYTWSGKNMASASNSGNSISYQYNPDGNRKSKTVNGITTTYTLDDNGNVTSQTDGTNTLNFTYDSNEKLQYLTLNGTKYTYETNVQGDVTGLSDSNGNEVVSYEYDSWGKALNIGGSLVSTVGTLNPFRYRGYYYDSETGLYYLQSRYYNPDIGRFISKDDTNDHMGLAGVSANLSAYADNNPVMNIDPNGHFTFGFIWGCMAIGFWLRFTGRETNAIIGVFSWAWGGASTATGLTTLKILGLGLSKLTQYLTIISAALFFDYALLSFENWANGGRGVTIYVYFLLDNFNMFSYVYPN